MLGDEYAELSSSSSRNLFLGGVTSCSVSLELGILKGEEENWQVRGILGIGCWNRSKTHQQSEITYFRASLNALGYT